MKKTIKIYNANIITPYRILKSGSVLVSDGKIIEISQNNIDAPEAILIDAKGKYLSPGFIDIHVHGGGGHDFMDGSVDAFLKVAEAHAKYGTTSLSPTTLTSEKEDLLKTLDDYEEANTKNLKGAQFIGMHLEGPYFALSQRGAQDPRYIRNPDPEEYQSVIAHSKHITRWSAAPELEGAIEFGRYLKSKDILAAIAHTDAIYEEALEAFENGYTLATHFYSSMSGVSRRNAYRYAGVVEAGYLIDAMDVEIIADGVHLPPPFLKLIYKIKGADRIALITDAMRGAGMPEGDSVLGNINTGLKVIIEDGVAKLPDRTSFAGSVATFDRLVRTMIQQADVPLIEAIKMATATPARIMNLPNKGAVVVGKDADLIIFDDNITIEMTMVNGNIIYQC